MSKTRNGKQKNHNRNRKPRKLWVFPSQLFLRMPPDMGGTSIWGHACGNPVDSRRPVDRGHQWQGMEIWVMYFPVEIRIKCSRICLLPRHYTQFTCSLNSWPLGRIWELLARSDPNRSASANSSLCSRLSLFSYRASLLSHDSRGRPLLFQPHNVEFTSNV